ncbi:MAG: sortase [Candidatus Cloacimonetes bacterium]|nr:sortase [Candidatus Cloacimonadota bacterium]
MKFLKILSNLLILSGIIYFAVIFYPIYSAEARYYLKRLSTINNQQLTIDDESVLGKTAIREIPQPDTPFANLLQEGPPIALEPVNYEGAILVPEIDVNAPIVWDVPVTDKNDYMQALNQGVAHAKGTPKPSTNPGNTYLFSHSTANVRNIARYAAVFTLLHHLQKDDRIIIFYQQKRYDYLVEENEVISSFDTTPLLREVDKPILTLQTCDPPGVPKNRRIVTAKLVGVYEK